MASVCRQWCTILLSVLMAVQVVVAAQAGTSLRGIVTDPSGSVVPSATVTLKSATGRTQTGRSDEAGAFRFEGLTPGTYEVLVEHTGFVASTTQVRVGNRRPSPLQIRLRIAALREEITVQDASLKVNSAASDNLNVVIMNRPDLDNLPALGQDVLGTAARFLDSASLGTGGATLVVDGMETSEKGVTASAIQQIRINQNPYSAEFGRPGRGRIEVITSPGASAYHGTFNFLLRDYRLDARNAFAASKPEEQRQIFEGSFTGPLGNGKRTSFLISAQHERLDLSSIIFAWTPGGEIRQNFPRPERNTEVSLRLNRQLNERNQLSLRYEFTDEKAEGLGPGGFRLPETAANSYNREHHVYVQLRSVITPRLVNELQTRTGTHYSATLSRSRGTPRIIVQDAFTGGSAQADQLSTENHTQFHDALTLTAGNHVIKAGVTSQDISRRGMSDRTNTDGTYYFSSLRDYQLGQPFSFTMQSGDGHIAVWQKELGVFFQDDFRLRDNLSLGAGIRWDWQAFITDRNNLAPRLSLAYSPGRSRKTVLRAGAGYFYDKTGWRPGADVIRFDGKHLRQILLQNPSFPNPWAAGGLIRSAPVNISRFASDIRNPYSIQYSFGVERQIDRQSTISVNYIASRGTKLYRSRDLNAPRPPCFGRPDPGMSVLRQFESSASQRTHGLDVTVRGRMTRFFNGTVQYALGSAKNDTGGINSFPADNYDLSSEWGRADFDQRHRLNLAGTFKASNWFNLGILFAAYSGRPYELTLGQDLNNDGYAMDRPAGVRRNSLQGPGGNSLDLRWNRDFCLDRSRKDKGPLLTVALDAFNVLNTVNYTSLVGNLSSPFFGQAVASAPARRVQVAWRLRF